MIFCCGVKMEETQKTITKFSNNKIVPLNHETGEVWETSIKRCSECNNTVVVQLGIEPLK